MQKCGPLKSTVIFSSLKSFHQRPGRVGVRCIQARFVVTGSTCSIIFPSKLSVSQGTLKHGAPAPVSGRAALALPRVGSPIYPDLSNIFIFYLYFAKLLICTPFYGACASIEQGYSKKISHPVRCNNIFKNVFLTT